MSLVQGRQNPVVGSIVVADVVLKGEGLIADKFALKDDQALSRNLAVA
jgi:hypothetical protein